MSDQSNTKPVSDRVYNKKKRKCLKCRETFMSEWPGERICKTCKASTAWREGVAA
ncbi:hypothetical protein [Kiloniella sp. b19]|uniref:hypothetical protein n=1 Tax=Kiloniella sp. GXU_MW_B19 TaxID=3141326 RepID=UPI0031D93B1E